MCANDFSVTSTNNKILKKPVVACNNSNAINKPRFVARVSGFEDINCDNNFGKASAVNALNNRKTKPMENFILNGFI